MMSNRQITAPPISDNPLWVSWHDTQVMASLSPLTVMDYFCRKSNPFYDRICNNETIKMQRLSLDHLNNMVGVEYILLHVADPILYVIRKQHRHSPTEATPIADYYIIGGMVYKAPDLATVINSRILSTVNNLQAAFEEASSYSRYHPSKGYSWDFSSNKALSEKSKAAAKKDSASNKDDGATIFQKQRVDMLLAELLSKFPPPVPQAVIQQQQFQTQTQQQQLSTGNNTDSGNINADGSNNNAINNGGVTTANPSEASPAPLLAPNEIKTENADMKPPPEKKLKL